MALCTPEGWAVPWLASPQRSVSDVEWLLRRHQDLEKLLAAGCPGGEVCSTAEEGRGERRLK